MNPVPTLSGFGIFVGAYGWQISGSLASIIGYPTAPMSIGSGRLITITTIDASLPQLNISDDDGSVFVTQTDIVQVLGSASVVLQPANQAQWIVTAIAARVSGGNRVHIVFPNAIHKGTSPCLQIMDFNPFGS